MGNCTNTGFSGTTGFTLNGQNTIPSGVICVLSGYVQSDDTQTVTVQSSSGAIVAQIQANGGTTGTPVVMTSPSGQVNSFEADGNAYTITFTNDGSQTSQVLSTISSIPYGKTVYQQSWSFITEDTPNGGDCDFNDTTAFLSWNLLIG